MVVSVESKSKDHEGGMSTQSNLSINFVNSNGSKTAYLQDLDTVTGSFNVLTTVPLYDIHVSDEKP